jgi:hypothetical protein
MNLGLFYDCLLTFWKRHVEYGNKTRLDSSGSAEPMQYGSVSRQASGKKEKAMAISACDWKFM